MAPPRHRTAIVQRANNIKLRRRRGYPAGSGRFSNDVVRASDDAKRDLLRDLRHYVPVLAINR